MRTVLVRAAKRLAAVCDTPRLDAELLMAYALELTREELLLRHLDVMVPDGFAALLERRMAHEPIAYITGTRAFWTIDLAVGPGALVPRADSETLIEAAVAYFDDASPATILDLGTGPGTLLLAALDHWPKAIGIGVDVNDVALAMARGNARRLGLGERARFVVGNWGDGIASCFDLVLANPPYIGTSERLPREVSEYEPADALFAGVDGLDAYRAIIPTLPRLLAPGGIGVLEIGATQAAAVGALAVAAGIDWTLRRDLAGRPRAIVAG